MSENQFKVISLLLAGILALLFIIFFGHIFAFISSIFIGVIGIIALVGLYISELKMDNIISFGIYLCAAVGVLLPFIIVKLQFEKKKNQIEIEAKKQREEKENKIQIEKFFDDEFQDAFDNFGGKGNFSNRSKIIETFMHASKIDSSDWRVGYSLLALGIIYSEDEYGVYEIDKGINYLIDATNKGNQYAEFVLGKIFSEGLKVKANYELAWQSLYKVRELYPSEAYLQLALVLRKCHMSIFGINGKVSPNQRDFKKAISYLNKAISSENALPLASFKLGAMTYLGQGTKKNYELAYNLMYNSVATSYDSEVIYLAEMYFFGLGVDKNNERALYYAIMAKYSGAGCQDFIDKIANLVNDEGKANAYYDVAYSTLNNDDFNYEYLIKSSSLGSYNAKIQIASHYIYGTNHYFEIDKAKAYELLLPLALNGNANAQCMISDLLIEGEGVAQDRIKGLEFLKLAAAQNHGTANGLLAFYLHEENININEEIFNYYKKAAELGNAYSCNIIGNIYVNGVRIGSDYKEVDFVKKDIEKGIEFLEKGANQGDGDCQFNLGNIYVHGLESISIDYAKSLSFFKSSYSNGVTYACKYLGIQYDLGLGVVVNCKKAVEYYQKFLENFEDEIVYHNLANAFFNGSGVDTNINSGLEYYEKGAKMGFKASILALAEIYNSDEKRVQKDRMKSLMWLYVAAELNFSEAYEHMKSVKDGLSTEGVEKAYNDAVVIASNIKLSK